MLNQVKAIYQNPIANIFLNDEILEAFPQNQKEDKTACQHCFYSIFTEATSHWKKTRTKYWKETKLFWFAKVFLFRPSLLLFFLTFFYLFLIAWELLYNILLVSDIYQLESATGIHISPPSGTSLPLPTPSQPSRLSQSISLSSLCIKANFHWLSTFHMVM